LSREQPSIKSTELVWNDVAQTAQPSTLVTLPARSPAAHGADLYRALIYL
jgi:hypothetical protein